MAVVLAILGVVIVHSPLPDPLVLILVLAIGAVTLPLIYNHTKENQTDE